MTTEGGILEQPYVQGFLFASGPSALDYSFEIGETRRRAKDGSLLVHRNAPFVGCAERMLKPTIKMTWQRMDGGDIDLCNDIIAYGGPLDVCIWRPISESFLGAAGVLARREAVTQCAILPPNAATRYGIVGRRTAGLETVTLGAVDAYLRTAWTATTTYGSGRIFVRYYPLFSAYVSEGQPTFSGVAFQQGGTLSFEEA
jgi:hypothetical protein